MANILTATEAANILRCASNDAVMLQLLPMVDKFIQNATGHDWVSDNPVLPEAKSAAQMLLVMWYENPAMVASGISSLTAIFVRCFIFRIRLWRWTSPTEN